MRDTPPDIQDGPMGLQVAQVGNFDKDDGASQKVLGHNEAVQLARECYEASTSWLNSGRRLKWADSYRAFQGQHASGSKYLSNDYRYRSRMFRPKTRAMVRRDEALTAAAFFSNSDVVRIAAQDENDSYQVASARLMQELLQYRLTRTIPWFQTLMGARQDANITGVAIAKIYWKYEEQVVGHDANPRLDVVTGLPVLDNDGTPILDALPRIEVIADKPVIDLIPAENFRFDPGADWRDPIGTSPYLICLTPMWIKSNAS